MKSITTAVLALSAMAITQCPAAIVSPPPPTTQVFATAGPGDETAEKGAHPMDITPGSAAIAVTPLQMTYITSPNWPAAAAKAVAALKAGVFATNLPLASPSDYAASRIITWTNLAISQSVNLWLASFDPNAPFQDEFGGPVPWFGIVARSTSGNDDISLDMLKVIFVSAKDGDYLGSTNLFIGDSYTSLAIGVREDGSIITNGPASQKAEFIVFLTVSKLFNNGDTQGGLDTDKTWVNDYIPYSITCIAQVVGDDSTQSSATVSTSETTTPRPIIAVSADHTSFSVLNADTNMTYQVWFTQQLGSPTSWSFAGIINGTNSFPIDPSSGQGFYRVLVQ